MDAGPTHDQKPGTQPWRPKGCDKIGLILQGGGALGAYQAGVYQAMHEAGLEPDWVAGVSIGSINGAIIAGNPPERRLERLRSFWETITSRPVWGFIPDGDDLRRAHNMVSAMGAMMLGQPGFFHPHPINPWLAPRGSRYATSFYDNKPLRHTLTQLVDFELLNSGQVRYAAGAVNVASGNFIYFDNSERAILPDHVMASGALPPALPMVHIGTEAYWDGGVVSNTPLQHLLTHVGSQNMLVFQVDLFSARGALPRDMADVMARQKDIQFSSRTRLTTDMFRNLEGLKRKIRDLLGRMPDEILTAEDRTLKADLADLPEIVILHLIYHHRAYEGQAKDYEFSAASMREHWESGYRDTERTLAHRQWLTMPPEGAGIVVHDVHQPQDG